MRCTGWSSDDGDDGMKEKTYGSGEGQRHRGPYFFTNDMPNGFLGSEAPVFDAQL